MRGLAVASMLALGTAVALSGGGEDPEPLRTAAAIQAIPVWAQYDPHPLALEAVVTLADKDRGLLVVQDATGAVAIQVEEMPGPLAAGQRIELTGVDSWPFLPELPRYPQQPDRREFVNSFESIPSAQRGFYLARWRGYVVPPASGTYRFAISSDDNSQLMLGTGRDPASRRLIAQVASYTRERDWSRTPAQRSKPAVLRAGQAYYIEAVHHQMGGYTHLSVAWEGPGVPLEVIPGKYLVPWVEDDAAPGGPGKPAGLAQAAHSGAILREVWDDTTVEDAALLSAPRRFSAILSVRGLSLRVLGPAQFPAPIERGPGLPLESGDNFRWCRVEGMVASVASSRGTLVLGLSEAGRTISGCVPGWSGAVPRELRNRRVRLEGVGEEILDTSGARVLGRIWLTSPQSIALRQQPPPEATRRSTIAELVERAAGVPEGAAVRFVGHVATQQGNELALTDEGVFTAAVSHDGIVWRTLGPPVEIEMAASTFSGLVVNSRSPTAFSEATFSRVSGLSGTPQVSDVGGPGSPGQFAVSQERFTIRGVGNDIWDTPDQFTFVQTPTEGECVIAARLDSFAPADRGARAGIMIREGLEADSQFIDIVKTEEGGRPIVAVQWRRRAEGSSTRSVSLDSTREPLPTWFRLERRYHTIAVSANEAPVFAPGEVAEVSGYVARAGDATTITNASARKQSNDPTPSWRPLLDIAKLDNDVPKTNRYDFFRFRGVVTFCDDVAGRRYWAMQDPTSATLLSSRDPSNLFRPAPGTYVEIHSNPGWFPPASGLVADNIIRLGSAAFPKPIRHPEEYLLPKRGEGTWIELDGIVRSVPSPSVMEIKAKGELFTVAISGLAEGKLQRHIDAAVRIRGVIVYPNERERLLLVPSPEHLEIIEPPAAEPFQLAPENTRTLGADALLNQSRHRTRLPGVVTYADTSKLYVQDEFGGARVELENPVAVPVGATIDAVGFPDWGEDNGIVLRHAVVAITHTGAAAAPRTVRPDDIAAGQFAFRLLRVRAIATRLQDTAEGTALELESDLRVFRAVLPGDTKLLRTIPPGSLVELTGVGVNEAGLTQWLRTSGDASPILPLRLLLRGSDDVIVLRKPAWWTVTRALLGAGAVALVAFVGSIWIQILRRRVRQRTTELAATMARLEKETRMSATLAERDRLAGEIHDSLEQSLNGLVLQLETTARFKSCSPEVRSGLMLARNMAAFSRAEAKHVVWELQSPMLDNSELPVAVEKIAGQIAPETLQAMVKVEGIRRRLDSDVEHHLLRIAQEAINNTAKHARARNLQVVLRYESESVTLSIRDDGCGFAPDQAGTPTRGHFGLSSLRSRAHKINGNLEIVSAPGEGTLVRVRVPSSPSQMQPHVLHDHHFQDSNPAR